MTAPFAIIGDPAAPVLIVVDHASNHVPEHIDLGVAPAVLGEHVAYDIGVAEVAAVLVEQGAFCAILGGVSRLVIDYNRDAGGPGLVPVHSDGRHIEGNRTADVAERLTLYYDPYHGAVERLASAPHKPFLFSLHSFTPRLRTEPDEARPWEIGVLWNQDERAARIAMPLLSAAGLLVGEQEPYSGKELNASMDRHGEDARRPYLGVELRQDLISDAAGQRRFAEILGPIVLECSKALAR